MPIRLLPFPALAVLALSLSPAYSQAPSKAEKVEGKLRSAILKANKGLRAPIIKASDLKAILDDSNLVLIDVRQPNEQAISMLPHAITTAQFAEKFRQGVPQGKRLVVYCTIGYRSGKYADQLAAQGIKAENLEGGVLAWSHAGGEFYEDSAGVKVATLRVHVYDKSWNFLHPDFQAVW